MAFKLILEGEGRYDFLSCSHRLFAEDGATQTEEGLKSQLGTQGGTAGPVTKGPCSSQNRFIDFFSFDFFLISLTSPYFGFICFLFLVSYSVIILDY